jgi:hypothetical protein
LAVKRHYGLNNVKHHYSLEGSFIYDPLSLGLIYKLTTGSNWAGGTIGDLTIIIEFPECVFLKKYNNMFSLAGSYRFGQSSISIKKYPIEYVFIEKGSLSFKANNYSPNEDIYLEVVTPGVALRKEIIITDPEISAQMLIFGDISKQEQALKKMNAKDLSLLRNAIFAWNGYRFKTEDITKYFSKFGWYIARDDEIILSDNEKNNLSIIKKYESGK